MACLSCYIKKQICFFGFQFIVPFKRGYLMRNSIPGEWEKRKKKIGFFLLFKVKFIYYGRYANLYLSA
jgi:hypothetical protein